MAAGAGEAGIWHFPKGGKGCGDRGRYSCSYKADDFLPEVRELARRRLGPGAAGPATLSGKVILVGDVGVGKTSLLHRFASNAFSAEYKATIGVDFEVEQFRILDVPFHLEVWDTAGQEKFRSLAAAYYRGARAVLVAFDLGAGLCGHPDASPSPGSLAETFDLGAGLCGHPDASPSPGSLASAGAWLAEARAANQNADLPAFLIGCKADELGAAEAKAAFEAGAAAAERLDSEFWPTSARDGRNVREVFHRVAASVFEDALLRPAETPFLTSLSQDNLNRDKPSCTHYCSAI